jgi:DNA end-binding protein Ku
VRRRIYGAHIRLSRFRYIVNQKSGRFEPEKFEDHYETALIDLINRKRAGKPITPKERPAAGNVVDLMEALR